MVEKFGYIIHAPEKCKYCGRMHSVDINCDIAYKEFSEEELNSERF